MIVRQLLNVLRGGCAIVLLGAMTAPALASLTEITWIGPSGGEWHIAANWDPPIVPNNAGGVNYHAIVDFAAPGTVFVHQNATISRLTIGSQSTVAVKRLSESPILAVAGSGPDAGVVHNSGLLWIDATVGTIDFRILSGTVTLTGGGEVLLTGAQHFSNASIRGTNGSTLINHDNLIRGSGNVGGFGSTAISVVNHGSIRANGNTGVSLGMGDAGMHQFTNHGLVEALHANVSVAPNATNAGQFIVHPGRDLTTSANFRQIDSPGAATTVHGQLFVIGPFHLEGGTLSGDGDVLTLFDAVLHVTGGVMSGNLQINAFGNSDDFVAVVNNTGGRIEPGSPVASGTRSGAATTGHIHAGDVFSQSGDGRLAIKVNGQTPIAQHDVLTVADEATLGGRLEPIISPGFNPAPGTQVTFLTADSVTGTFSTVWPCSGVKLVYGPDSAAFEFTGVIKHGDFDCNGTVDVLDMLRLFSEWGACPSSDCPADLNGDGAVDVLDMLLLFGSWG